MEIKQLNETEQEIMNYLWNIEQGFMKDIVEQFPEPKPAYTTISTLLNRMCAKEYIGFTKHGRDKLYYPILQKKAYFSSQVKNIISNFFDNSAAQFASFFTEESDLSIDQLKELQDLVNRRLSEKTYKK